MNAKPISPDHAKYTVRRSETERRGIVDNIPATGDQGMKLLAQPVDYDQRADLHSLSSMISVPMETGRFLPLAVGITVAVKEVHQGALIHKEIKPNNILVLATHDLQLTASPIASLLPPER